MTYPTTHISEHCNEGEGGTDEVLYTAVWFGGLSRMFPLLENFCVINELSCIPLAASLPLHD